MSTPTRPVSELLEELASEVVLAQPNEKDGARIKGLFEALAAHSELGALSEEAQRGLGLVKAARDAGALLQSVADCVENLQQLQLHAPAGARVARDAETLELMSDFLQEADNGVTRADEVLLAVEAAGATPDHINSLFRVFHTIKGVAGFLELKDVPSLAHVTESVLTQVRDGALKLDGEVLEAIFDSTTMMRELLEEVRRAVETSTEISDREHVTELTHRIESLLHLEVSEVHATEAAAAQPAAAPEHSPVAESAPVAAPLPRETPAEHGPAAPAPSAPAPAAPAQAQRIKETVKVDLERVDRLVEMIGELLIAESMVTHAPELSGVSSLSLKRQLGQLRKISRDLQDVAMRMRMVPVRGMFQKMARLTRELARKTGKHVILETSGEGTEMDRSLVESLEDPLVHMLRNGVDHGVETPEERKAAGKPEQAVLRLSAFYEGGSVIIQLSDDGRGLRRSKILETARRKGVIDENAQLTESEIDNLIFAPGFSTAAVVTDLSGRGVGMDVVKKNVESLRGRINLSSVEGKGTTFRLTLPLTLAVIDGMLISCGKERYLLPSLAIIESLKPTAEALVRYAERREFLKLRGKLLPLVRLSTLLQIPDAKQDPTDALVVVLESMGQRMALLVDDVLTQQQVVIKPLANGLEAAEQYAGAAILSDGRVGLILNVDRIHPTTGAVS